MSKDPGWSDSKADRQGSQIRELTAENKKLQEKLAEAYEQGFDVGYVEDINGKINALKNENIQLQSLVDRMKKDYAKDMAYKDKQIKFLEEECKRIYDPIREFWNMEKTEELENLKKLVASMKEALMNASEYARCDDVNGEAGTIAQDCLNKLFKEELWK